MGRISERFQTLRSSGRKALIPFITAGDPQPGLTVAMMQALVRGGADIIELGVPFSDPMADGPVIQRASERALAANVNLHDVLAMVAEFRAQDQGTPVVLMGYLNPIEAMGHAEFAAAAAAHGVDGVLTVDLPPEEGASLNRVLRAFGLDPILLLAPTSSAERIRRIVTEARGFVYYVALKGVTGAANLDFTAVATRLRELRAHTDLPIGVGFGIHDAARAAQFAGIADAVVVGSALVSQIEHSLERETEIPARLEVSLGELRQALDGVIRATTAA